MTGKFENWHVKGGDIGQFCDDCVDGQRLWYTPVYRLFYCRVNEGTSVTFSGSLLTTVWITEITFVSGLDSVARLASAKEAYEAVLYQNYSTSKLLAHDMLQFGRFSGVRGQGPQEEAFFEHGTF